MYEGTSEKSFLFTSRETHLSLKNGINALKMEIKGKQRIRYKNPRCFFKFIVLLAKQGGGWGVNQVFIAAIIKIGTLVLKFLKRRRL